jgi:hypothetical protein
MNCCRETAKMGVPPGNRPAVPPERYVAGFDTRGRQGGLTYPWSQQVIHEISGLGNEEGASLFGQPLFYPGKGQDTLYSSISFSYFLL